MRRKLPPLNALHAFEAAARLGSFTKAARELGVAQPAVTRHVGNLEAWLDEALFTRNGNVLQQTPAGEYVAELATATFDRLELGLRNLPARRENEVVIGASFGIAHLYLMPRLAQMRAATSVTVNFLTSDNYRDFDTGDVDLSIRFGNGSFGPLHSDLLFAEECYVVAAPSFLGQVPDLDLPDLAGSLRPEWLLDHGDPHDLGWVTWTRWFSHFGRTLPSAGSLREIRNYPALLDMVRHGEGLAIGSVGLEDHLVEAGDLVRIGPPVARPGYGYYLVYDPEVANSPNILGLRERLVGKGKGQVPPSP